MKRLMLLVILCVFPSCAASPSGATDLIGADFDDLRARLGAPLTVTTSAAAWTLGYRGRDGAVVDGAVHVIDGVVIYVAPDLQPTPPGEGETWCGASIGALVGALGPARVVSVSTDYATVVADGREFSVICGRVAGEDTERQGDG